MVKGIRGRIAVLALGLMILLPSAASGAGLDAPAQIVYDQFRVPTVVAQNERDAIFLQGYLHAQDRFFQMDFQRRQFSGTLSELIGSAGLGADVQLRTLGLRRAAERSLPLQTPETLAWLEAYSAGVNAWLDSPTTSLPIEYTVLEIDRAGIPDWTPLDTLTMVKGLAFGLSFSLDDIDRTLAFLQFLGVGEALGFNGLQLFSIDLYRAAPFDPTISIPPGGLSANVFPEPPADEEMPAYMNDPNLKSMLEKYIADIEEIPMLERALRPDFAEQGSNWWVVSGDKTESGFPMLTNDPHLALDAPATFYEIHLNVAGGINATGISFPGAPGLVQGCNDTICWGSTVNPLDVTDVYQEVLLALDPSNPTQPTHSVFQGNPEPLQFIPQQYFVNGIGDGIPNTIAEFPLPADQGGVTIVVPRRNNGPVVQTTFDPTSPTPLTAISVQYTGWSGTQELEAFRLFARAQSPAEFKAALQFFDVGSQNWGYADVNGNIAYWTSAELPIREDLQFAFFPDGLQAPFLIRDGTNTLKHEWLPVINPQPNQSIPYEMLPFDEMPQIENPPQGYIINANNDPIGTSLDNVSWNQFRAGFNGALYLSPGYASGYRAGRIQRLVDEVFANGGKMSEAESVAIQANNQLLDAEVLTPYLLEAFENASEPGAPSELAALAADPGIAEAIGRLQSWNFSTPTGLNNGFDPFDNPFAPGPPSQTEIDASVAASIYAVWRGQIVQRTIDTTLASLPVPLDGFAPGSNEAMKGLRNLLDNYSSTGGTGAGLLNFFTVPGVSDQFVARDIILLQTLGSALALMASDDFADAFGNSTNQEDYRWGLLHRIVFDHPLGDPFSIPPPGDPFNTTPQLRGFARAGGLGAVDASAHSARADGVNEFMFGAGPARRVVATMTPDGPQVQQVIPGGQSGIPGSPNGTDQLILWLVNAFHLLPLPLSEVNEIAVETLDIVCGDGNIGPGEQCDDANGDENDGCQSSCMRAPRIACRTPEISADPETCSASLDCQAIAGCTDPDGNRIDVICDDSAAFGPGTSDVQITCPGFGTVTEFACPVTVVDDTPPTVSLELVPDVLWPPNHRLVDVRAQIITADACDGEVPASLVSIVSSETDDKPGPADGETTGDIAGAIFGTDDRDFQLRAERDDNDNEARVYTIRYSFVDSSGNDVTLSAEARVDFDRLGITEPIEVTIRPDVSGGTRVDWSDPFATSNYNVVRGNLGALRDAGNFIDLGAVTCIESGSGDLSTAGDEDMDTPAVGQAFFYLVEFVEDGQRSSYGSVYLTKPRVVASGDCP